MGIESIMMGGEDESILNVIKDFFNKQNIETKTDIDDTDISIIIEILWHSALQKEENKDKTAIEIVADEILPTLLQLRVSRNRKSRSEFENILKGILPALLEHESNLANDIKR